MSVLLDSCFIIINLTKEKELIVMKKILNITAFIVIVGLVGAWECGDINFRTMLLYTGITLCFLMILHFLRFVMQINSELKKHKKHKLNRVKIS